MVDASVSLRQTVPQLEGYRVSRCSYGRRFKYALVLINPSTNCTDEALPLNGTWYEPDAQEEEDEEKEAAGGRGEGQGQRQQKGVSQSTPVTEVVMAPQHARILLAGPLLH
eukprot:SAG22_NODE_99_length_20560_cov_128.669029_29_plen_111_part_00